MSSSKSFFKAIVCSTIRDYKLRIPDIFVENYGDELSDLVRLIVPTGDIWCVRVEKIDKTIWLQDGLQKFIEDHSIKFGSFLIFDYGGNSIFNIRIFESTAMEIQYPIRTDSARLDDVNLLPISEREEDDDSHHGNNDDENGDDSSIECLGSSADHQLLGKLVQTSEFAPGNKRTSFASAKRWRPSRCYLTRSKKQKIQDEGGTEATSVQDFTTPRMDKVYRSNGRHKTTVYEAVPVSSKKANRKIISNTNGKNNSVKCKSVGSKTSPEVDSEKGPVEGQLNHATEAANTSLPKNPLYKITLKPYNCQRHVVNLPTEFARLYLSYTSKFIKILDADDNEWEVRCNANQRKGCQLTRGWKQFLQEKKLMVGDVCLFEPIRINEEVKLKVKIFHAAE